MSQNRNVFDITEQCIVRCSTSAEVAAALTYSIAGADTVTRQVGGTGTSCLSGQDVYVIYGGVPGHGVVHAQARYNVDGRQQAALLLAAGESPTDIVQAITEASFDRNANLRQYGVVDVLGNTAGFTGDGTMAYAEDRQGQVGSFSYSVQGNILTSAKVLDQAAAAFERGGCDLADRLMVALEAGAQGGEGDSRCTPDGIPSDSAFLQVERPDGAPGDYLALRVETSGSQNPLPRLRQQFDAWRADHPCPVSMPPSTTPPMSSAGTSATPETGDSAGCSCHFAARDLHVTGWLLLGFVLVFTRWRRRTARQLGPIHAP